MYFERLRAATLLPKPWSAALGGLNRSNQVQALREQHKDAEGHADLPGVGDWSSHGYAALRSTSPRDLCW